MIVSKIFYFEAAHMLSDYSGECSNLHGHSYKLEVALEGELQDGMVIDFKTVKTIIYDEIVKKLDHAFLVNVNSKDNVENALKKVMSETHKKMVEIDGRTTAENIILYIKSAIIKVLPDKISLRKLILHETKDNFVTWGYDN